MKTYLYVCRCGWTGQVSEAEDQACPLCDRDIELDDTMLAPPCDYCGAPDVDGCPRHPGLTFYGSGASPQRP